MKIKTELTSGFRSKQLDPVPAMSTNPPLIKETKQKDQ